MQPRLVAGLALLALVAGGAVGEAAAATPRGAWRRRAAALAVVGRARVTHLLRDGDLAGVGDKLQGILDAVSAAVADLQGALKGVDKNCGEQVGAALARIEGRNADAADLSTVQAQKAGVQGGLQAELEQLERDETETQASYASTVALRAKERQSFMVRNATATEQAVVVGEVLEKLRLDGAVAEAAAGPAAAAASLLAVKAGAGSSPGFGYVIGVFTNMQSTLDRDMKTDAKEHAKKDTEFLSLVGSYKATLQNINKEYKTKNAQKMEAQVAADNARREKALLGTFDSGEEKVLALLQTVCGSGGGGAAAAATTDSGKLLERLRGQVARLLASLDALPPAAPVAATLLQLRLGRKPEPPGLPVATAKPSGPPAATAAQAKARMLRRVREREAKGVAMEAVLQAAEEVHDDGLERVARELPGESVPKALSVLSSALSAASSEPAPAGDGKMSEELEKCVNDKKDLTGQIVDARRAARGARTQRATAKGGKVAAARWEGLAKAQQEVVEAEESSRAKAWAPLNTIANSGAYADTLADALQEMDGIDADVAAYVESADAPPKASALPIALKGVRKTLKFMQDRATKDMDSLLAVYGNAKITQVVIAGKLKKSASEFKKDVKAAEVSAEEAQADVEAREAEEKDLMAQRDTVDARCEVSFLAMSTAAERRVVEAKALSMALEILQSRSPEPQP